MPSQGNLPLPHSSRGLHAVLRRDTSCNFDFTQDPDDPTPRDAIQQPTNTGLCQRCAVQILSNTNIPTHTALGSTVFSSTCPSDFFGGRTGISKYVALSALQKSPDLSIVVGAPNVWIAVSSNNNHIILWDAVPDMNPTSSTALPLNFALSPRSHVHPDDQLLHTPLRHALAPLQAPFNRCSTCPSFRPVLSTGRCLCTRPTNPTSTSLTSQE